MIDILILILINSALCFGFWNACLYVKEKTCIGKSEAPECYPIIQEEQKGALWFIEKYSNGKWFYKPLCGCLPCMASLHSIYPYWTYMYFTDNLTIGALIFYPVYVLALSGVNYLIDRI